MVQKRIIIPNPHGDAMGATVASLLEVLEQWAQIQEDENIVIDMSRVTIVNPFFILPLCALVSANAKRSDKIKFEIPSKIGSYLQTIHFPNGFSAAVTDDWEDQISGYAGKSYLPACNTNCYSKCRIANFEFTMVNADRPIKQQIELSENMRHFIG